MYRNGHRTIQPNVIEFRRTDTNGGHACPTLAISPTYLKKTS